jgi:hypothetical protein
MPEDNPYAAPQSMEPAWRGSAPPEQGGVWRSGRLLVMRRDAQLPPICIKSNEPATGWLKRKLSWHHPLVFAALLLNVLAYIILALVMRKQATIYVGLSDEHFRRRRRAIVIGWLLALSGIGLFVAGIALAANVPRGEDMVFLVFTTAMIVLVVGCVWGIRGAQIVAPKRINDSFLWLKGAAPAFLERFPDAPPDLVR